MYFDELGVYLAACNVVSECKKSRQAYLVEYVALIWGDVQSHWQIELFVLVVLLLIHPPASYRHNLKACAPNEGQWVDERKRRVVEDAATSTRHIREGRGWILLLGALASREREGHGKETRLRLVRANWNGHSQAT